MDPYLLGQSEHATRDGRYELREVHRDLSGAVPGRRVDAGNERSQPERSRTVRIVQARFEKEDCGGRRQPSNATGRPPGRRGWRDSESAEVHSGGAVDCVERLWIWATRVQPGDRVLQGECDCTGLQYRPARTGAAPDVCASG